MRRVVVTGVGAVSPVGADVETTWQALLAGKSGIGPIQRFDASTFACRIAGECLDFDPEKYIEKKRLREGDRFIHLAMGASVQAVENSGLLATALSEDDLERVGTFIGVGLCGLELIERMKETLLEKGPRRISPYFIPAAISNLAPGHVSMRYGFKGPNYTTTSACSSGAHAVGEAFRWIQRGDIDVAVAGGAESTISGLGVGGFTAMRALSERNDEPQRASRPFDRDRDGFVMAEGAGVMILEERERAIARGANILCEILGYGATSDAYHLTQPAPEGEGAQRAMKNALRDGKIDLERVHYVNAHATSTPTGDKQELQALKKIFGERALGRKDANGVWISATKSMTGHLLGAAGGIEAVFAVLALRDGAVPPTINLENPDDEAEGMDLVPHEARRRAMDVVLSNSFGFGGTNVTLAFGKH
ncbi:beta-ketoacyl-ACP synthase II [Sandaracinus amylolyticus]|uniref:beta-ketoacyl-ACP synthase II n=1 Tax=Sandaracinus amylolyticus TaxID=927083 RepID=UPI001F02EAD6|nr:beta-ketoacyl-ACP synthase II [Sandaracinus amylolyticus]UJR80656.1 Beta-ketoacyl-[acyl-carrier-protein] synthase II [Sandaracinus amylolyticus]